MSSVDQTVARLVQLQTAVNGALERLRSPDCDPAAELSQMLRTAALFTAANGRSIKEARRAQAKLDAEVVSLETLIAWLAEDPNPRSVDNGQ